MRDKVVLIACLCLTLCGDIDPYAYGVVVVVFLLINLPALLVRSAGFLHRYAADAVISRGILPANRIHAATMATALMPNVREFVDPVGTVSRYRRETERLEALKEKLDAQTALAEAVIRNHRARNRLQPHV